MIIYSWLVVEPNSLKNTKISWDDDIPNMGKYCKTCSKAPTSGNTIRLAAGNTNSDSCPSGYLELKYVFFFFFRSDIKCSVIYKKKQTFKILHPKARNETCSSSASETRYIFTCSLVLYLLIGGFHLFMAKSSKYHVKIMLPQLPKR